MNIGLHDAFERVIELARQQKLSSEDREAINVVEDYYVNHVSDDPFNENDRHFILNALAAASERYREHADTLREIASSPQPDNAFISQDGARMMAEQFEHQVAECHRIAEELQHDG